MSGIASAVRHRLFVISTYGLSGLKKAYTSVRSMATFILYIHPYLLSNNIDNIDCLLMNVITL